jgi:hypothetical protein
MPKLAYPISLRSCDICLNPQANQSTRAERPVTYPSFLPRECPSLTLGSAPCGLNTYILSPLAIFSPSKSSSIYSPCLLLYLLLLCRYFLVLYLLLLLLYVSLLQSPPILYILYIFSSPFFFFFFYSVPLPPALHGPCVGKTIIPEEHQKSSSLFTCK